MAGAGSGIRAGLPGREAWQAGYAKPPDASVACIPDWSAWRCKHDAYTESTRKRSMSSTGATAFSDAKIRRIGASRFQTTKNLPKVLFGR